MAWVIVVLTTGQEVVAFFVIVLVDDGHAQLVSQLPAILQVGIAGVRARTCCAYDDDFGVLLHDFLIHVTETLTELW